MVYGGALLWSTVAKLALGLASALALAALALTLLRDLFGVIAGVLQKRKVCRVKIKHDCNFRLLASVRAAPAGSARPMYATALTASDPAERSAHTIQLGVALDETGSDLAAVKHRLHEVGKQLGC